MATLGAFARRLTARSWARSAPGRKLKTVQFRSVAGTTRDTRPDRRVLAGDADLGAAWKTASQGDHVCLSVSLEAPSFVHAIPCASVAIEGVHTLVWSRGAGPKED